MPTDDTSAGPEVSRDQLRSKSWLGRVFLMAQMVRTSMRRAGDPCSNLGPSDNFSLKLIIITEQFIPYRPSG